MNKQKRINQIIDRFNHLYDIGEFRGTEASYLRNSHLMNMNKTDRNNKIIDYYQDKIIGVSIDLVLKSAIAQIPDIQKLSEIKSIEYIVSTIQANLKDMGEWDQAVKICQLPELHIFAILENIKE